MVKSFTLKKELGIRFMSLETPKGHSYEFVAGVPTRIADRDDADWIARNRPGLFVETGKEAKRETEKKTGRKKK